MIKNKTIICLSTIDWNFARQRHQILMEKFARAGNQVIFVEHLGFSRQKLTDINNMARRILRALKPKSSPKSAGEQIPNLQIITPLVLPPQNKLFNLINKYIILNILAKKLLRLCDNKPIVWTYLATTTAVNLADKLAPVLLIYDCVYDAIRHPEAPKDIAKSEQQILLKADIVFTDAGYFYNLKKNYKANVYQVPPGVDFEHFNCSRKNIIEDKMQDIKKPRICFFGCIGQEKNRIDLELLKFIALKKPGWSIVIIGPDRDENIAYELKGIDNIIWLGFKSYEELPGFLCQCDVLILPYQLNDFTESILPAKVFECLATGKPVVATAMPELKPYKEFFAISKSKTEFLLNIEDACVHDSSGSKQKRIEFAKNNTWNVRFNSICEIIKK